MDDELAALTAEVIDSVEPSTVLEPDTTSPNVTTSTEQISHDDNDIHLHMQALDDSGHSVTSAHDPSTNLPQTSADLDLDHHIDTIEEVIIDSADSGVISTVSLFSPSKAVLSTPVEPNEQDEMFHEEEVTRVLTTLESAKKHDDLPIEELEIIPNKVDEPVKVDVVAFDISNSSDTQAEDVRELARRQLEDIGASKINRKPKILNNAGKVEKKIVAKTSKVVKEVKGHRTEKSYVTPKNKIKFDNIGTIEIPKELISGAEELHSSVLLNSGTPLKNEDLLAILEGSDDEMIVDAKAAGCLDKDTEKKLALKQIMSLPPKQKGRRPKFMVQAEENPKVLVVKKPTTTKDLVNALVMDWSGGSDSEAKSEDFVEPPKKLKPLTKKLPIVIAKSASQDVPVAFKRSRIIKKKIIWDPDAPETAVSYASLIQPSAAFIKKTQSNATAAKKPENSPPPRILNKIPAQIQQQEAKEIKIKRTMATPSPNTMKKRKISEIDRLLGDEGAVNMLNALKQENNNTDSSEHEVSPETLTAAERKRKAAASPAPGFEEKYNPRQPRIKRPQTPQKIAQPIKKEPVKRKKPTTTDANSWDYIYSKRDEEALIIRRRSNSSYSSSASNTRLSIEGPKLQTLTKAGKVPGKPGRPRKDASTFEFAKPNDRKSVQSNDDSASTILLDIRPKSAATKLSASKRQDAIRDSSTSEDGSESSVTIQYKPTPKEKKPISMIKVETSPRQSVVKAIKSKPIYQEIRLERKDGVANIVLAPFSDQLENVFTLQMMREVCKALFVLDDDTSCKVVLISSATATFCNGLDYSSLMQNTAEKRRTAAAELASDVGKFIESLASFRKTLIAGIHGHVVGLGVTILPLFDLVLANANSTFETPYARLGQIPEACSVFLLSNKISHNAKTELLQLGETLDAASAHGHSLVTKVIHSNGFDAELQRQVALVAKASVQSLEAAKAVIHTAELAALPVRLAEEQKVLQQHWLSSECQNKIRQLLATKKW